MKKVFGVLGTVVMGAFLVSVGCGDDGGGPGGGGSTGTTSSRPDQTGAICAVPADCYPDIDPAMLQGEVMCLDRVRDGYCTHTCTDDTDCCAVTGECKTEIKQVCSPFESTGLMMCFLSCEDADLVPAPGQSGPVDPQEYCQREAGRDFICRSSGGGSNNRKVCVPGDCGVGAACITGADCLAGLDCVSDLLGGYCTMAGCTANADCPGGSVCVKHTNGENYCFKSCVGAADCTFCRGYDDPIACIGQVEFVEAGTAGTVCAP